MPDQNQLPDTAAPPGAPIFDFDIPCPHCKYNLRGLTEPRCPECGELFDPKELLDPQLSLRPPGPGFAWAIPRTLRHPVSFWSNPQVRDTAGPNWGLLYLYLAVNMFFCIVIFDILQTIWDQQARCEPIRWGFAVDLWAFLAFAAVGGLLLSVLPFAFCLLHGILCRIAFKQARVKDPDGAAKALIGYSAIWILAVAPAFTGVLFWFSRAPAFNVGLWLHAVGAVSLPVFAVLIVAWSRTLYEGGRSIAIGSASYGLWCAITNPFWYIGAFLMFTAWKNR